MDFIIQIKETILGGTMLFCYNHGHRARGLAELAVRLLLTSLFWSQNTFLNSHMNTKVVLKANYNGNKTILWLHYRVKHWMSCHPPVHHRVKGRPYRLAKTLCGRLRDSKLIPIVPDTSIPRIGKLMKTLGWGCAFKISVLLRHHFRHGHCWLLEWGLSPWPMLVLPSHSFPAHLKRKISLKNEFCLKKSFKKVQLQFSKI